MFKKLNVVMGECESVDDVMELLNAVAQAVLPDGVAEATEKAAEKGAEIAVAVKQHQFLKHADVSEYNKLIAKAFPDHVEEKKKECDCSQDGERKNKHKG